MDYQLVVRFQHESFIKFLYASVMVNDEAAKNLLEDIAIFKYRHMIWAMQDATMNNIHFNMDFDTKDIEKIKVPTQEELLNVLKEDLKENLEYYQNDSSATINRFRSDDEYFLSELNKLNLEGEVIAFSDKKELKNVELTEEAKAALAFFLVEETFKEYELITIYSYLKVKTDNKLAEAAFTDLAYDSIYHLKRFATLANEMGVLTLPRPIPEAQYEDIGIVEFLKANIEEELDAEKQCLILAEKIGNKELSDFLLFISKQETYHAHLLQRALDALK